MGTLDRLLPLDPVPCSRARAQPRVNQIPPGAAALATRSTQAMRTIVTCMTTRPSQSYSAGMSNPPVREG